MDAKGYDQAALSRASGIREGTLSDALRRVRAPRRATLIQLCDALGVSVDYVMKGADERADKPRLSLVQHQQPRAHQSPPTGVSAWLDDTLVGRSVTPREREQLVGGLNMLLPNPWRRYPDLAYELALTLVRYANAIESGRGNLP
jgi:transcriptional regulator with XRE-family HTH domain